MSRYKKLDGPTTAKLLNRIALGGSYEKIAEHAGVNPSTAWNYAKHLPLWKWFRDHSS